MIRNCAAASIPAVKYNLSLLGDEGELDMLRVMTTLKQVGYRYMVMPDHMPTHPDDPGGHQAFAFGYGYVKAMIQAVHQA